jgi:hypothetical protein
MHLSQANGQTAERTKASSPAAGKRTSRYKQVTFLHTLWQDTIRKRLCEIRACACTSVDTSRHPKLTYKHRAASRASLPAHGVACISVHF